MVCKMKLNDSFWKHFELDLQEIKLTYLNWAIGYTKEPKLKYRHLFLWDHQDYFCPINSKYGRAFTFSPFGPGVRGVPRQIHKGTEIYAGHIETGTKKQTDFLADFWAEKLDLTEDQESVSVSLNQEK
jgi:hypothetical protein